MVSGCGILAYFVFVWVLGLLGILSCAIGLGWVLWGWVDFRAGLGLVGWGFMRIGGLTLVIWLCCFPVGCWVYVWVGFVFGSLRFGFAGFLGLRVFLFAVL